MREKSGNESVAAFSMSHPAVPALYMVLTLGLTMFSMQPVLIALSLAVFTAGDILRRARRLPDGAQSVCGKGFFVPLSGSTGR